MQALITVLDSIRFILCNTGLLRSASKQQTGKCAYHRVTEAGAGETTDYRALSGAIFDQIEFGCSRVCTSVFGRLRAGGDCCER
jgi:hypothetical protein